MFTKIEAAKRHYKAIGLGEDYVNRTPYRTRSMVNRTRFSIGYLVRVKPPCCSHWLEHTTALRRWRGALAEDAAETPIGWTPHFDDINWKGLGFPRATWDVFQAVDREQWKDLVRALQHLCPPLASYFSIFCYQVSTGDDALQLLIAMESAGYAKKT